MGAPIRTCISCRRRRPKGELIRVGVNGNGNLTLDGKGKKEGRGSYICRDAVCAKGARKIMLASGRQISDSIFRELEHIVGDSGGESDSG